MQMTGETPVLLEMHFSRFQMFSRREGRGSQVTDRDDEQHGKEQKDQPAMEQPGGVFRAVI